MMDFSGELKKLLALEYNCSESEVGGAADVITVSDGRGGRNYSPDSAFFSMATTGANCLITADERLMPFLRELSARGFSGHSMFKTACFEALERELSRFGFRLNAEGAHHMFLPKYDAVLPRKYTVRRLDGVEGFGRFYGDTRFPNALCEKFLPERPDVIALLAPDGENIMGMAGASRDYNGKPSWLQIGVDVLPEHRGRGVGAFLVNELTRIILQRGDVPFYGTAPANIHSQNIAINCGFRPAWVEISAVRIREGV